MTKLELYMSLNPSQPRPANILIVDDEPANLLALRAVLEGAGDRIVEANSGEDALRKILAEDFAVILLDVQMRGVDGLETARLVRQSDRSRETPIIFVTAFDSPNEQIAAAYKLGAVDYLIKPLVPAILRAKVDVFIELFRKTERLRQLERQEVDRQLAEIRSRREQTALAVTKIAAQFTSESDAVLRVLQAVCDNLSWDAGAFWEVNAENELACAEFWQRPPPSAPELESLSRRRRFARGEGLPGRVWAGGRAVWLAELLRDDNFPRLSAAVNEHIQSALAFPIASGDQLLGVMEFFSRQPRRSDDETLRMLSDVGLQFGQFLRRRRAEDALAQSEQRMRAVLDAALDCVITINREGRVVEWNPAATATLGYTAAEAVGRDMAELIVPPQFRAAHRAGIERLLTTGAGTLLGRRAEMRARRANGEEFLAELAIVAIPAHDGPLFTGYLRDITDQQQAAELLRQSESRFRQLADAMPQIIYVIGPGGQVEYLNRKWHDYTGRHDANDLPAVIHPEDLAVVLERYQEAEARGLPYEAELRLRRADGEYRWFLTRAMPVVDETGRVTKWYGTSTDIDDTKRAEETAKFLAEASATLADLGDPDSTLQKVAGLAVPHFADWCTVDLVEDDGQLRRLAAAHVDPSKVELARELHRRYPPDPHAPLGVWNIIRTGESEIVSEITDELLEATTPDAEVRALVRELGLRSYLGVPLAARGKTRGVLTFIAAESGRRYNAFDLAVAEDLARRAAVAIENAYLYSALQEEDRRKDEFLATLAHELRNPLAPIRNGLQVLKLLDLNDESAEQSRAMMERQLEHLVRLVDDLLDVSRVSRGKIELRKERIDLARIVDAALETSAPAIQARGHQLSVVLPDEPVFVEVDRTRLAQAVGNLLHNAAKYTDPGGQIALSVEGRGGEAVICVKDTGVGIPSAMLPKIFDLFTQVDRSLEKAQGGLGIGLTLVRRMVELHGGSVEASSAGQERGSEFSIRLPLAPSATRASTAHEGVREPSGAALPRRILVVDDNVDAAASLAMMLRMMGHEAQTAHDGLAAVEVAASWQPDVILLDIGMPRLNGYDACRQIRERPCGRDFFIVALTGWGQDEDKRRSKEAGFNAHLVKPIDLAALDGLLAAPVDVG